jgi:hypothetical protein
MVLVSLEGNLPFFLGKKPLFLTGIWDVWRDELIKDFPDVLDTAAWDIYMLNKATTKFRYYEDFDLR